MAHINWDTLQYFKGTHHTIHHLLKRYYGEQDVTEEELVKLLESIKSDCTSLIDEWNYYLGQE